MNNISPARWNTATANVENAEAARPDWGAAGVHAYACVCVCVCVCACALELQIGSLPNSTCGVDNQWGNVPKVSNFASWIWKSIAVRGGTMETSGQGETGGVQPWPMIQIQLEE